MEKPSDYFKKLDLAHLDANTAQFIREKVLTLPNIDILEGTKEFETIKAIIEESFPRAIGIEPKVIEPIIEVVPEAIIEEVIAPIIDTKQVEIDSIITQVSEMSDLIELMNEVVAENKDDLDSKDILELYNDTLVDLKDKLSKISVVILDAIEEVKENIEEVKEIIKTDVIDSKGILTAPKKYKTEDGEEVLGYESDWNFGLNKHLGETVVYYVSNEDNKNKYSVLTGILHKGEIIYSTDKTSNKEFENYSENKEDALKLAYELANDKEAVDKFALGGSINLTAKEKLEKLGIKYTIEFGDKNRDLLKKINKENNGGAYVGYQLNTNNDELVVIGKKGTIEFKITDYDNFPESLVGIKAKAIHFKDGGSVYRIPYNMETTGLFKVVEDGKTSEVKLYGAEKKDNDSYSFYQTSDADDRNKDFTSISIKNSAISKLSKGVTVYGINEKNGNKVKITRIADLFKDGGSIGFIPMDLEEELSWVARFGGMSIKGVIGILSAMIDSGITKEDLELEPSKTSAKREKIKDAKIKEVWAKAEPFYKGDLKGNMYYSATSEIIRKPYLLDKFRPWRKTQKLANGGEIKNLDKIKKSIGDTIYSHISSLNEEQLEKQLKELKVELNREISDSKGKSERYKKLSDEMFYILYRLERTNESSFKNGGEVGDNKFTYMMLGRLQSDNDYFLGHGNRGERSLWAGNVDKQIEEMKKLWNSLPEDAKPEWLSMEDILEYERKMKGESSDSYKDENIAKIRFNGAWKKVQLFIDGSLHGEFDAYQDAIKDAENNNSKVINEDDVTMLTISESNPLSNQLVKLTGDSWNTSDFVNLDGGNNLTTSKPFKHIGTGKIFEVVKK